VRGALFAAVQALDLYDFRERVYVHLDPSYRDLVSGIIKELRAPGR